MRLLSFNKEIVLHSHIDSNVVRFIPLISQLFSHKVMFGKNKNILSFKAISFSVGESKSYMVFL